MLPKYKIKFLDRALTEIAESWDWYEEQQYGLGDRFQKAIATGATTILKDPFRYAIRQVLYREVKLKKFPFVLIYKIDEPTKTIEIVSVFHTKRNPTNKYK